MCLNFNHVKCIKATVYTILHSDLKYYEVHRTHVNFLAVNNTFMRKQWSSFDSANTVAAVDQLERKIQYGVGPFHLQVALFHGLAWSTSQPDVLHLGRTFRK